MYGSCVIKLSDHLITHWAISERFSDAIQIHVTLLYLLNAFYEGAFLDKNLRENMLWLCKKH